MNYYYFYKNKQGVSMFLSKVGNLNYVFVNTAKKKLNKNYMSKLLKKYLRD